MGAATGPGQGRITMPRTASLLLLLVPLLAACGDDPATSASASSAGTCALLEKIPAWGREPMRGTMYAQEVWIAYHRKGVKGKPGYPSWPRKKPEAEVLAKGLCRKAHSGDDIGDIARGWSNGNGAVAEGIVQLPVEANRTKPDAREIVLFRTKVGALTPLIEWEGGFWFARRIPIEKAMALGKLLEQERKRRARARVIHIHHAGAWPRRHEFDEYTKAQARQKAWAIIKTIEHGADFEEIARNHSNDGPSRKRGGLMKTKHPITREETEWFHWGDRTISDPLLRVILEECPPGKLWPQPVESERGIDVVMVLERRMD